MHALTTVFFPLGYLGVRHPLKRFVDVFFPVFGALTAAGWLFIWPTFNLFGSAGAVTILNSLIQNLPGFYITCLAAIATFTGDAYRMDDLFEGEKALLGGDALTRRQFLCHLFAYLCLISLLLYILGSIGISSANSTHGFSGTPKTILKGFYAAAYGLAFGHMAGTTLIGLVFLAGRVPQAKPLENRRAAYEAVPIIPEHQEDDRT